MENSHTEFSKKVIELIKSVPKGKVATYGLIADLAGNARGSRGVGWLLHSSTRKHKLPWQRIIKSSGRLSFPVGSANFIKQRDKLEAEGIVVVNGRVDLKQYLWQNHPKAKLMKKVKLPS